MSNVYAGTAFVAAPARPNLVLVCARVKYGWGGDNPKINSTATPIISSRSHTLNGDEESGHWAFWDDHVGNKRELTTPECPRFQALTERWESERDLANPGR